jgi:prepilin peptidase CpaA
MVFWVAGTALAFLYPVVLVGAAISDILWLRIPNWLSALLAVWFVVYAVIAGVAIEAIALRLGLGASALLIGFALYSFGLLGGGDVKLIAASAIWVGPHELMMFLLLVAISGGVLAAALFFVRKSYFPSPGWLLGKRWYVRLISDGDGIPYGVAICAGGLLTFHEALAALPKG